MSPQEQLNDSPDVEESTEEQLSEPLLLRNEDTTTEQNAPTFWGLFLFRFLFFLGGLSASTWGRFGVVYYNEVAHLSPQQIGILQGLTPLLSFVAMPCWGVVADWIQSRKKVFLFTKVLGTICLLALSVVPHDFTPILLCVSGLSLFRASGVLDAFVLDYLGESHRSLYGSIRLWTAVSWGIGAVVMGWITDTFGFHLNFILFGSMMAIMLTFAFFGLPARSKSEQARYEQVHQHQQEEDGHPKFQVLVRALCRLPVVFWLLQVITIGCGMALVDTFLFLYLQNDLGASTKLCGLTVGITVLMELPIFHYSQFLLERVGHDALFCISMAAYAVRVFGYTFLTETTIYWILPLEILHGITFACMWIASVEFSATVAPDEWSTTVQTILSACFACFGNVLGGFVGGWVMQKYGAVALYRGMGWIVWGVLILHLFLWLGCQQGHDAFLESLKAERQADDEIDSANESLLPSSPQDELESESATINDGAGGGAGLGDNDKL
jgi:PPP family 3-phenylpropionic acid transporter